MCDCKCDCDAYEATPDQPASDSNGCPFCYSGNVIVRVNAPHVCYVVCCDCAAEGPVGGTVATAVRLWNIREKP